LTYEEQQTAEREAPKAEEQSPDREPKPDPKEDRSKTPDDKSEKSGDESSRAKEQEEAAKKSSPWVKVIGGLVLVLAIAGGVYYYFATKDQESTDDAYTDGRALTISPKVSGYVIELLVDDNQRVKTGDVLARIDPRDYIVARDQARASLDVLKAQQKSADLGAQIARKNFPARLEQAKGQALQAHGQLYQAQAEFNRQHAIAKGATTQQAIDQSTAQLQLAQGQVQAADAQVLEAMPVQENIGQSDAQISQIQGQAAQAQAQFDQAELNVSYCDIKAPQDGWITKRNIEKGNYLQVGGSIFSIVTPEVWITANFKESQLARMRTGQMVRITLDAYPDLKLEGHVDSVQLGSGSKFTAFPPENATGNFVKIVQRVPVKIIIDRGMDPAAPLPLGISVVPTVMLK
jgi:membrane fusion protein (multidrug efflux system)